MDTERNPTRLDPFDEVLEEYLRRRHRGERPTPAEYADRYPELAPRILEFFPALEVMEWLKPTTEERAGLSDGTGGEGPGGGAGDRLQRLGDYAILRELGRGGMGIVYEAERQSLKSRVALKVMHPRFRAIPTSLRRFQNEALSAAKLHHTNIVPVFDYGEQDGVYYYAMQYIAGVGLERVLEDVRRLCGGGEEPAPSAAATESVGGPLPAVSRGLRTGRYAVAAPAAAETDTPAAGGAAAAAEESGAAPAPGPSGGGNGSGSSSFAGRSESVYFREVARLGAQVADALDYAHRLGVFHRDIKPSNLLLDAQGNVWVTDFGLAKLVEGEDLSQSHDLVGTLRYMAPERFRGVTDRHSDIYALGATLYEFLTLRPAFAERDQARLVDQITHESPKPLRLHDRRIPRDLETLVLKALAKDPKDRFASAGELGDELRRYLESRPIRSRPVGPAERLWRWCKRNPGLAAASITAALLMAVLAVGSTIAALVLRDKNNELQFEQLWTKSNLKRAERAERQAGLEWAMQLNNQAWELATGPAHLRDPERAVILARKAVAGAPASDRAVCLNTLGVALYRAGRYALAIETLGRSLAAGKGQSDAFDLYFLAMARFKLGQMAPARADFDGAVRWRRGRSNLPAPQVAELDAFESEAQALLDYPPLRLPDEVFAPVRP